MKVLSVISIMGLVVACQPQQSDPMEQAKKPNIIYILADDLGYGDVGAHGQQKIETPNRSEERRVGKECRSRWSPYH